MLLFTDRLPVTVPTKSDTIRYSISEVFSIYPALYMVNHQPGALIDVFLTPGPLTGPLVSF